MSTKKIILEILNRYARGEFLVDLLNEYKIDPLEFKSISTKIAPDAYDEARRVKTEIELDEAKRDITCGADLYRAKLRADMARWTAARVNRAEYGDQVEVNVNHSVNLRPFLESMKVREIVNSPDILVESKEVLTGSQPVATEPTSSEKPQSESLEDIFD